MGKRLTFEEIDCYTRNNSKCDLIKTYTEKRKRVLELKCHCGEYFKQGWSEFKRSPKKQCLKCTTKENAKKRKHDENDVISEIKSYGLELLSNYIGIDGIIKLKCPCGREFENTLYKIRISKNKKCQICRNKISSSRQAFTHGEFISNFNKIKDRAEYLVLGEYQRSSIKIKFKHTKCGNDFDMTPNHFINGNKRCPFCNSSKGEKLIKEFLDKNNIRFEQQYKFEGCKNIRLLPFDFYLLDYNACIEMQGEQHTEKHVIDNNYFGGIESHVRRTKNDLLKNKFCRENSISLTHIWYYEKNQINKILKYLLKI